MNATNKQATDQAETATPAKKPTVRGKSTAIKNTSTDFATKAETAPRDEIAKEEATEITEPSPVRLSRPVLKPATFRLPLDALEIIADAQAEAAAHGDRLTRDAVVTDALRTYAKAKARRKK